MTAAKRTLTGLLFLALAALVAWLVVSDGGLGRSDETTGATETVDSPVSDEAGRPRERARPAELGTADPALPEASSTTEREPGRAWAIRVTTNVPGAEVTVTFRHYGGAPESPAATKRADAAGFAGFDLPEHPDGLAAAEARATAPGHVPAFDTVLDGQVQLKLSPGVVVRGLVVSGAGAPIEGASVEVRPGSSTYSAADGTFEVWTAAAGAAELFIDHPAHLRAKLPVEAPADGVRVILARGHEIRGRVAFADQRPLPGVQVGWGPLVATTDADGRYVLSGLPDGEFELICECGDAPKRAPAGATDADFVVTKCVARLRFVDEEGRPFRHAALWVRGYRGDEEIFSSASSGSNTVELVDAPAGTRLQISPSAEGYERRVTEVTLDGEPSIRDVPVVIRRAGPSGAIDLRVVDTSGAARRTTTVSIDNEADAVVGEWYAKTLALDASGRAAIEDLPPGALRLTVGAARLGLPSASYDLPVVREVRVTEGARIPVEVSIGSGGRIVVAMRNASGEAVAPRGRLTVLDPEGKRVDGSFWQPTEGGGWTSSSDPDLPEPSHFGAVLAAGLYRVRFERDGRQPIEVDASVVVGRTTDVDVRLDE